MAPLPKISETESSNLADLLSKILTYQPEDRLFEFPTAVAVAFRTSRVNNGRANHRLVAENVYLGPPDVPQRFPAVIRGWPVPRLGAEPCLRARKRQWRYRW